MADDPFCPADEGGFVRIRNSELRVDGVVVVTVDSNDDEDFIPRLAAMIEDGKMELNVPLYLLISSWEYGLKVGFGVKICLAEIICEQELPTVHDMLKNGIVGEAFPTTKGDAVVC